MKDVDAVSLRRSWSAAVVRALAVGLLLTLATHAGPAHADECPSSLAKNLPPGWPCETIESRPNWGILGAGLVLFALSYVPMIVYSLSDGPGADGAAVPIVGPWTVASKSADAEKNDPHGDTSVPWLAFGAVGVIQITGVVFAIVGAVTRDTKLVPAKQARTKLTPNVTQDGGSVRFSVAF